MTRAEIEQNTVQLYRTAGGTRPDLRVVQLGDQKVVVKDFKRSDKWFRLIVGPILIARERKALATLEGVDGIPQLIGSIDRYAIAMEHIEGASLKDYDGEIPQGFFDKLLNVLKDVHDRGITHCDLRSSGNVMVSTDGTPVVVDFAACVIRGRGINPLVNFLYRQFVDGDNYAALMLKRKHAPDTLRPEEVERLSTPLPYEQMAINTGKRIRNLTRKILIKKKK